MNARREWLKEIAGWQLEAADEDNSRYFYQLPGVSSLQAGEKSSVLGRKGSGKTAVAEHVRGLHNHNVFIRSISFKNFPFNELYKLEDNSYTSPSQYTTIWKYIIYVSICGMMSDNAAIDPGVSGELSKYFAFDVERGLARSVSKITDRGGGFTLFGNGVNATQKKIVVENDASWQERSEILEGLILDNIDDSVYYIVIDELDEDYKDVFERDMSKKYKDLLTSLFKAVQDVRRKMRKSANVRPIIFLRSDIYELLQDNDKNKWQDSALKLVWSEASLRDLTAFRLSRANGEKATILPFDELIDELFTTDATRAGGLRRRRHVFHYILAYTLRRPRDIISYIRECAKFALENGNGRISPNDFSRVNKEYSLRMRQEFRDEIQGAIPCIDAVFDTLSLLRKQIFQFTEFKQKFDEAVNKGEIDTPLGFEEVCKILFHYSVIGNQPSQKNAKIFQYLYPSSRINFREKAVLHPSLLQALQIN